MNEYKQMAEFYDLVTPAYFNYKMAARTLCNLLGDRKKILELGIGTGELMYEILNLDPSYDPTGIEHTAEMLAFAQERIGEKVQLLLLNILEMDLPERFDAALSNGGIWYFAKDGDHLTFHSHLANIEQDKKGLNILVNHLKPGALCLLSVQKPHSNYTEELEGGILYSQKIAVDGDTIFKDYYFEKEGELLAHQRINHRFYNEATFLSLIEGVGLQFQNFDQSHSYGIFENTER